MTKLSVGLVGCGLISQARHIPSFMKLRENVSVEAVCDLNAGLAREVATRFGIARSYSNITEMLAKENLDIVDVCTPPQSHRTVAIEAMESGSNVLLEKPMALTVEDCRDMIRVSQVRGVKLSIMHNERYYPAYIHARRLVQVGRVGKVTGMRILSHTGSDEFMNRKAHWVHKLPGGVIGETGPHVVYLSLPIIGDVDRVQVSAGKTLAYPWVEYDNYFIQLDGRAVGSSIVVSHATKYTAMEVDIFGTEGMIRVDLQSMLLSVYGRKRLSPLSLALSSLGASRRTATGVLRNALASVVGKSFLGHFYLAKEFVRSVENDAPPPVTPEEGMETTRVMGQISAKCDQLRIVNVGGDESPRIERIGSRVDRVR